jgi:hypothetical protein
MARRGSRCQVFALGASVDDRLQQVRDIAHRHRRTIVGALVVGLGGFGVTAFGIAPLAPDAALLPQRVVVENVTPADLSAQADALAEQPLSLLRHDITRATDTPESLLSRLAVADASVAALLRHDATARRLLVGRGGKMVQAATGPNGELIELVARFPAERSEQAKTHFTRMTVSRVDGRWLARLESAPLVASIRLGSGTIRSSLFAARSEERRVGKECRRLCRSRWSPYH